MSVNWVSVRLSQGGDVRVLMASAFYFTLDVFIGQIYGHHLNLMEQTQFRWLTSALIDGNHYMYLCFACPSLFGSRLATWLRLRDWIFPTMADESRKFDRMVADLVCKQRECPAKWDFYKALRMVKDPRTGNAYPEEEIGRELKMTTRAGRDRYPSSVCEAPG